MNYPALLYAAIIVVFFGWIVWVLAKPLPDLDAHEEGEPDR